MSWIDKHGLINRLDDLPLIICGPIVRRVEAASATVWFALTKAKTVTLRVWSSPHMETVVLSGTARTVSLGQHLHVAAVTARPTSPGTVLNQQLPHFYNLFFSDDPVAEVPQTAENLQTLGVADELSYSTTEALPGFVLPPSEPAHLRVVHGSCRKPHGVGRDALPALDELLKEMPVVRRPQQLLLTGDQIYADDVADALLPVLTDAGNTLLAGIDPSTNTSAWQEQPPDTTPLSLRPGRRDDLVKEKCGFTMTHGDSHLVTLAEFFAMYLFAWSEVLWPADLPDFADALPGEPKERPQPLAGVPGATVPMRTKRFVQFPRDRERVQRFREALPQVRRALANIATYMIFDDHEITDDWNLTRDWSKRVYDLPLGRRVLQNGLLSYAVFQAWGNTPQHFAAGESSERGGPPAPGRALLDAASAWIESKGTDQQQEHIIATRVGVPFTPQEVQDFRNRLGTERALPVGSAVVPWHFDIRFPCHEIIALDMRTWRSFPGDRLDPSDHLTKDALDKQLTAHAPHADGVTMVMSPTNFVTIPLFFGMLSKLLPYLQYIWYWVTGRDRSKHPAYNPDLGDSWRGQTPIFELLLSRLAARATAGATDRRSRMLFLSGDVHFGWTARLQYWSEPALGDPGPPPEMIIAHLTSSAQKNEVSVWQYLHRWGYVIARNKLPDPLQWAGWAVPPTVEFVQPVTEPRFWRHYNPRALRRPPALVQLTDLTGQFLAITPPQPDWRYRIDYLLAAKSDIEFSPQLVGPLPPPEERAAWFKEVKKVLENHRRYAQEWGDGLEIVGKNNVGEIVFRWPETTLVQAINEIQDQFQVADASSFPEAPFHVHIDDEVVEVKHVFSGGPGQPATFFDVQRGQQDTTASSHAAGALVTMPKHVAHTLWWRLTDKTDVFPLSRFTVSLEFDDADHQKPVAPGEGGT